MLTVTPCPRHVSHWYLRPDLVQDPEQVSHLMLRERDSFLQPTAARSCVSTIAGSI